MERIRVKGENSDFKWMDGTVTPLGTGNPLYLKLFICPYNQPSKVEKPDEGSTGTCSGTDKHCPNNPGNPDPGHALIHLHEEKGIELVTDKDNRLTLDQDGNIHLQPASTGKVHLQGDLSSHGNFTLDNGGDTTLTIRASSNAVHIEVNGGAKFSLKSDGNIDLFTAGNQGTVKIHADTVEMTGDVKVAGNLTVTGTINGTSI